MSSPKINLIRVFGLKEAKFWKRTWTMRQKLSWIGFGIALIFLTAAHYAFALMHFLFEGTLFIGGKLVDFINKFRKEKKKNTLDIMFKANMVKLYAQVA